MKQGWEIKKLGEICKNVSNINWKKISVDTEYPYIDLSAVDRDSSNICDYEYVNKDNAPSRAKQVVNTGDVIFATTRPLLKRVCVITELFNDAIASTGFCVLRPTEKVISKWIYYKLKSDSFYKYIEPHQKGISYPAVSDNEVKNFILPIPPREEQERIVAELDCLSGVIEKKKQQLKELDALAQSIFYQMFGDPNTNDRNWNVVKLNTTCDNLDYQRRPITAKDRIDGDIPYYGASGVVDYVQDYIFDGDYLLVSEDGANLEVRHTPIAFSIKGKTWVNNHAHILKFEHYCTQVFMEYYINLLDISDIITGCAQPKLTQANLNSINVFDISIEKQQEFADKIEAIERQKELIKQSIIETETLFNSRMNYYFN